MARARRVPIHVAAREVGESLIKPTKALRLVPADHPRILALLRWLEAQGGVAAKSSDAISAEVGFPAPSTLRWWRWAELYGAVHIDRCTGSVWGKGANPPRYTLLMPVVEYESKCREIQQVVRDQLRPTPVPRKGISHPRRKPEAIDPAELAAIKEEAAAEVAAAVAGAPIGGMEGEPVMTLAEAEAWNAVAFTAG